GQVGGDLKAAESAERRPRLPGLKIETPALHFDGELPQETCIITSRVRGGEAARFMTALEWILEADPFELRKITESELHQITEADRCTEGEPQGCAEETPPDRLAGARDSGMRRAGSGPDRVGGNRPGVGAQGQYHTGPFRCAHRAGDLGGRRRESDPKRAGASDRGGARVRAGRGATHPFYRRRSGQSVCGGAGNGADREGTGHSRVGGAG